MREETMCLLIDTLHRFGAANVPIYLLTTSIIKLFANNNNNSSRIKRKEHHQYQMTQY